MNTFLSEEQYQTIVEMRQLRTRQGGKYLWLLGANVCTIQNAETKIGTNGKPYVVVTFSRLPQTIFDRRIYFAPHEEYFFAYGPLNNICEAHGHDLKPCPPDYPMVDYFKAVCRRLKTFTGEITVTMGMVKKVKRDDYGKEVRLHGSLAFDERGMPMTVFDTPEYVYDYSILNYTGVVNWSEVYKKQDY